jgi:hypothetical protein
MPGHTQRLVKFCWLEKEAGKMLEENKSVPVSLLFVFLLFDFDYHLR